MVVRVLLWQSGIGCFLSLSSVWIFNASIALGVLIGVVLVVVNTWWMARVSLSEASSQKSLYQSAVLRYLMFFVVLLLAGWLGVHLLASLAGMGITYLVLYGCSASFLMKKNGVERE